MPQRVDGEHQYEIADIVCQFGNGVACASNIFNEFVSVRQFVFVCQYIGLMSVYQTILGNCTAAVIERFSPCCGELGVPCCERLERAARQER